MALKDILINLATGIDDDATIDFAISLAGTFDAHLAGVAFAYDAIPPAMLAGEVSPAWIEELHLEAQTAAQAALDTAQRVLGEGKLLGMYPEGTRSPDGRLYKGKTGLARLALETGVPVIPVAMIGTNKVNPPGTSMLRFGKVTVRFGKPMDFSRFEGLAGNRFIERAVIDEVIYELMGLSGQEYVDIYAATVKDGNGSGSSARQSSSRIPQTAAG